MRGAQSQTARGRLLSALNGLSRCAIRATAYAIGLLVERMNSSKAAHSTAEISDDTLIDGFRQRITSGKFVNIGKAIKRKQLPSEESVESADGFLRYNRPDKYRAMLRAERMRDWYQEAKLRNRLIRLLRARRALHTGRQKDALTRLVTVTSGQPRVPCYGLSLKALGLDCDDLDIISNVTESICASS